MWKLLDSTIFYLKLLLFTIHIISNYCFSHYLFTILLLFITVHIIICYYSWSLFMLLCMHYYEYSLWLLFISLFSIVHVTIWIIVHVLTFHNFPAMGIRNFNCAFLVSWYPFTWRSRVAVLSASHGCFSEKLHFTLSIVHPPSQQSSLFLLLTEATFQSPHRCPFSHLKCVVPTSIIFRCCRLQQAHSCVHSNRRSGWRWHHS